MVCEVPSNTNCAMILWFLDNFWLKTFPSENENVMEKKLMEINQPGLYVYLKKFSFHGGISVSSGNSVSPERQINTHLTPNTTAIEKYQRGARQNNADRGMSGPRCGSTVSSRIYSRLFCRTRKHTHPLERCWLSYNIKQLKLKKELMTKKIPNVFFY